MKPVLYLRMSKASQETSIPEQRKALQRLAKEQGASIVREYVDEAISGDATERRTAFQRMIADAANGEFDTILCWDQDRFGRFNSIEAGYWIFPLVQAGVKLVTIAQGVIDWGEFSGRMMYAIQQEGKHDFLRSLSRNIVRGKLAAAQRGEWISGRPPHGYVVVDQKLVVEPESAAVVSRIFEWYVAGGSLGSVAARLNESGTVAPKGGLWSRVAIQRILSCRAYLGEYAWNRRQMGKYVRVKDGRPVDVKAVEPPAKDPSCQIVIPNHHEAIISQAEFDSAQRRLAANRLARTPIRGGGDYLFTGLIRCGHCGSAMVGRKRHKSDVIYYQCNQHRQTGNSACRREMLRQDTLAAAINACLEDWFQVDVGKIRGLIIEELSLSVQRADTKGLEKQLQAVNQKLDAAKRRLVEVDRDMLQIVQTEVRRLMAQKDDLASQIKSAVHSPAEIEAQSDRIVKIVMAEMASLKTSLDTLGTSLRAQYQKLIRSIRVTFPTSKSGRESIPQEVLISMLPESPLVTHASTCDTSSGTPTLKLTRKDFERVAA